MSDIETQIENRIAVITLNRPKRRNSLTFTMWKELAQRFRDLGTNSNVRGIVIAGAQGTFCAGADISEFGQVRANAEQGHAYEKGVDDCADAIAAAPKPTIAAVSGFCFGGGCGIAMACDFRFVRSDAIFSIPAAKLSIVYGMRETQNLLALVGLANAKRILFSGERFDGQRAFEMGFADRIEDDPLAAALKFATSMVDNAPITIAGSKVILTGLAMGQGALDPEDVRKVVEQAFESEDYREGQRAFLEKRAPIFKGR
jgi:enoyl-CoA hydratase/carnithine racemase